MLALPLAFSTCFATPGGLDSPDPNARVAALVEIGRETDRPLTRDEAQGLVEALSSIDPSARMVAIRALQRRTGESFGYQHFGTDDKRRAAIGAWRRWFKAYEPDASPGG